MYRTFFFVSQIAALTTHLLGTLTRALFKVLRDYQHIRHTSPSRVLTTTHMGGILKEMRVETNKRKWGLKGRMLTLGGPGEAAMQSLLTRLHRVGFRDLSPTGQATFLNAKPGALPRWGDELPVTTLVETGLRYIDYDRYVFPTLIRDMGPTPDVPSGEILEELSTHYRTELTPDGVTIPNWFIDADDMRVLLASNITSTPIPVEGNRP